MTRHNPTEQEMRQRTSTSAMMLVQTLLEHCDDEIAELLLAILQDKRSVRREHQDLTQILDELNVESQVRLRIIIEQRLGQA